MEHKNYIEHYENLGELADKLGDLKYDKLADFLYYLSLKLKNDSDKDKEKNRIKLSKKLNKASEMIFKSSEKILLAWNKDCKHNM